MERFVQKLPVTKSGTITGARQGSGPTSDHERPAKRARLSEDSHTDEDRDKDLTGGVSDGDHVATLDPPGKTVPYSPRDGGDTGHPALDAGLESALPEPKSSEEAIEDYERTGGPQEVKQTPDDTMSLKGASVKGKSSIYVDAFNLALDTVLEYEAHLFDERERHIFSQWKALDYEYQYLYVRLFLRKTASWHRIDRLGYYNDVSDMEKAVLNIQKMRTLPEAGANPPPEHLLDLDEQFFGDGFSFADCSDSHITTAEEATSLLGLDELKSVAKEHRIQGKGKAELARSLCQVVRQQTGLREMGVRLSKGQASTSSDVPDCYFSRSNEQDSSRERHFVKKILAATGPCIRISQGTFRLFQRVHLVFYRSTEWSERSLTTIILAKISRRNFADYVVCRTSNIFTSRSRMLEFEAAVKIDAEVDMILESGDAPGEKGFRRVVEIFETIYHRWRHLVAEEQVKEDTVYEYGEGAYLRRLTPAHTYTRVVHKAAYCLGRLKDHGREHALLTELLDQRLFHMARRGSWYQRKALLEEHYMYAVDPDPGPADDEQRKKYWKAISVTTCETGLQDVHCHLIYHHDLQKRLVKLERRLRIPRRLQHDFGHVRLQQPIQHTAEGIQLKREDATAGKVKGPSTKTAWVDEREGGGECSVEEMCLSWYRAQGWKGYHSEGGIVRTLFALLFFDVIFAYVPNVFQTAYQTCPLDLHTDSFYPARVSEINRRLADISNGGAEAILREVYGRESERKTCVAGLKWDFELEDLAELTRCFPSAALAAVCKVMAQEYRERGGGIPDLILWRPAPVAEAGTGAGTGTGIGTGECMFAEVKSANDRLSDTQRLWIHVLMSAGVDVALCNAVAKEVRVVE